MSMPRVASSAMVVASSVRAPRTSRPMQDGQRVSGGSLRRPAACLAAGPPLALSPPGGEPGEGAPMSEPAVLFDVDGGVATITLNRPENRNSMTPDVLEGFRDAIRRA